MLTLEWRLTLISVMILPLFLSAGARRSAPLREIAREQMEANAQMNAMMNETLNIGGALLVKLFGRASWRWTAFGARGAGARYGRQRAVVGSRFFVIIGLISAVGTALVYWHGRLSGHPGAFTVGTIVALARTWAAVRRAAGAHQRAGGVCHLDGQLRARL
jgi:ATP-binding cassette, subfamily B, bacterial